MHSLLCTVYSMAEYINARIEWIFLFLFIQIKPRIVLVVYNHVTQLHICHGQLQPDTTPDNFQSSLRISTAAAQIFQCKSGYSVTILCT